MVIATLLLLFSVPPMDDTAKVVNDSPAVAYDSSTKDSTLVASALPSAPAPKVKADVEPIAPNAAAQPFLAAKPVFTRPRETPRQKKIWYALTVAGHSGAAFDAWSTHRAVAGGYGQEANPFLRPYASSHAIYAATQVSPLFMDYLGKRMMVSQHGWVRKLWWLPQTSSPGRFLILGCVRSPRASRIESSASRYCGLRGCIEC